MSVKGVWAMSRTLQKWCDNRCYKLNKDKGLLWADSWETVWETHGSKLLSAVTGGNATSPQLTSPASVNERLWSVAVWRHNVQNNYPSSFLCFFCVFFFLPPSWWVYASFKDLGCIYPAELTTEWIRGGAVPLLFVSFGPVSLRQVWVGVPQCSPLHSPLLQPPHPTLRSADEIWPEELQGLLMWGGSGSGERRKVSRLLFEQIQWHL